jgi:hypothetical protein
MMEFSSPLAAMHPPPCPPWGNRRDLSASRSMYQSQTVGSNSFNFKELSMKKTAPDYFTLRPARGSSPTASLAADLSSNFHIDQRYACTSSTPFRTGPDQSLQSTARRFLPPDAHCSTKPSSCPVTAPSSSQHRRSSSTTVSALLRSPCRRPVI